MVANRNLHEAKRLASLDRYNILDTAPEEAFDRITRLAKQLLNVPITLISLVDENRQWFKSRQGPEVTETPREISFCTHAIEQSQPLIVQDALADDRFHDNPLVVGEPGIRFYIGAPLRSPDGSNIGTLCAIDLKPREVSKADVSAICDLARLTVDLLELRQVATTDSLTRLLNLQGFNQAINKTAETRQPGQMSSLIIVDIDDFDAVAVTHDHAAADLVLQNVTSLCRSRLHPSNIFARLGGHEFAILMRGTEQPDALALAKELCNIVATIGTPFNDVLINVTISIAVSVFSAEQEIIPVLLKNSAIGLQKCKRLGGDRIVLIGEKDMIIGGNLAA